MKITSALLSLSLLLFSCSHNNETEALFLKADSLMDEYPDSVLQLLNLLLRIIFQTKNAHAMHCFLHVPRISASSPYYLVTRC